MNIVRTSLAVSIIALSSNTLSSNAMAQSQAALDWVRIKFSTSFNREPFGWTQPQIDRYFGKIFDRARISGEDAISAKDEKMSIDIRTAQLRANTLRNVLTFDLNGDNSVSRDEVRTVLRHKYAMRTYTNREARMQREFDRIMRNDVDRNGTITLEEIRKSVDVQTALRGMSLYQRQRSGLIPMTLDANGDKIITRDEFMAAIHKVVAEIDTNNDKLIDEKEMGAFMRDIRNIRRRQARERSKLYRARRIARSIVKCRMPDWPKDAKPVFAATYRGLGLANVTFKNQQRLLSVAQVHIEEGPDNLALILSAPGNVIWQITGVKERVAKVYLGSRFSLGKKSSVAVTGIDKSKVHFIEASGCLPYSFSSNAERQQIGRALRATIGKDPVSIVAIANNSKVTLPSGKLDAKAANPLSITPPKGTPAATLWAAVSRSFPAGIVRLPADQIVSQIPLTKGQSLPGRAGLAQLIDQGALEVTSAGIGGSAIPQLQLPVKELRIVAPIHMPTGIGTRIVRKFVLAKDVKIPTGLSSRVCVVNEADGKPVQGSGRCR